MVKKTAVLALGILLLISFIPLTAMGTDPVKQFSGTVKYVDVNEKSVVVGGPQQDMVFYIDDDSKIKIGKVDKKFRNIRVGNIVKIGYSQVDGDNIVKTLSINL